MLFCAAGSPVIGRMPEGKGGDMKQRWISIAVAGILSVLAGSVGHAADIGPFGPSLGAKADVVRSFTMKVSGAMTAEVKGRKGDELTGLLGQCNPTMFANFGIEHGTTYKVAEISIVSSDPIKTGMTGEIKLDKIWVRFSEFDAGKQDFSERRFGGKGKMTLKVHDASPGKRRMTGTITGSKLKGLEKQQGKVIDVTSDFDMDFSCGVK